jgi:Rieske 2Fe-2S family protein
MPSLGKIRSLLDQRRAGHSLPQPFYTDPDIYEFDLAAIYGRSWIMVGFETEVPRPGSYLALTIGRSPVVVVRDEDGALRAFFNSCRHRGAQICPNGTGHARRFVCPYHQWSYSLDGTLHRAGRMSDDFDLSQHGLRPIHVETVAGTVYVCLADEPPPFSEFRDHFEPLLGPHDLAHSKVAFESILVERANWKLVMENARECYHCAAGHPELARGFPVTRHKNDVARNQRGDAFRARMAALDLGVGPVEGQWWQASRFPLNDGYVSLSMDGRPAVKKPMGAVGDGDVGTLRWALEPHSFAHALGDYVFMFSAMPAGAQETIVTSKFVVHEEAVEGVDYDMKGLTELWLKTNDQDRALAENNQRGVNSIGYIPGPYAQEAETLVLRFTDWYCQTACTYIETNA